MNTEPDRQALFLLHYGPEQFNVSNVIAVPRATETGDAHDARRTDFPNNTTPMTRRDFFRLISAHIVSLAVLSAGCGSGNSPTEGDVPTATDPSEIPADALLAENGNPLLAENGDHLLTE